MLPSLHSYYLRDNGLTGEKPVSDGLLRVSFGPKQSHFNDLTLFESGITRSFSASLSALAVSIFSVVFHCAEKEMGRVATVADIAGMTNAQAVRYLSMREFKRKSMSLFEGLRFWIERTVSISVLVPKPSPAGRLVSYRDFSPKSVNNGFCALRHDGIVHQKQLAMFI
jgi:hypothetical protein